MTTQICNLHVEALFVSTLQPSEDPSTALVRATVLELVSRLGEIGPAALVAQEYGEHPDCACRRMKWCRTAVRAAFQPAQV